MNIGREFIKRQQPGKSRWFWPVLVWTLVLMTSTSSLASPFAASLQVTDLRGFVTRLKNGNDDFSTKLLPQLSPITLAELSDSARVLSSKELSGDLQTNLEEDLEKIARGGKSLDTKCVGLQPTTQALAAKKDPGEKVLLNQMILCDAYPGFVRLNLVPIPPVQEAKKKDIISKISGELDEVDRSAEAWGRATISDIALIDNSVAAGSTNGFFDLQYNQPTEFYMSQVANSQGFANLATAKQTSVALTAMFAPGGNTTANFNTLSNFTSSLANTVASNATVNGSSIASSGSSNTVSNVSSNLLSNGAANGSANTATSTSSTSTSSNSPPAVTLPNLPTNVPPIQITATPVIANTAPQLSQNTTLKIGATDKVTERILNYMSDPINLADNKRAFLGIMQVSVLPGWQTKMGYICEIQVNFEFAISRAQALKRIARQYKSGQKLYTWHNPATGLEEPLSEHNLPQDPISSRTGLINDLGLPGNRVPTIISAFPFAEAQILDLTSSLHNQLNFLAQLAGSVPQVPGLQASLAAAFQKLTTQSLATRNALPLVVPSSRGSDVTYRFDPELQALVEPWNSGSKSGQVLEPSSFPALVVIICEDKDLEDFDTLSAAIQTRWIPVNHRHWFKTGFYDWWRYGAGDAPGDPYSNQERLQNAWAFDHLNNDMGTMLKDGFGLDDYITEEVTRRFENLKTAAMGRTLFSQMPPIRPYISAIYPERFRQDFIPEEINIRGRYFKTSFENLKFVGLQGIPLKLRDVAENLVTAQLPKDKLKLLPPGTYELEFVSTAGQTVWTNAVTIDPVPAPVVASALVRPVLEYVPDGSRHRRQRLTILGQNFVVHDHSLKIAIGGAVLHPPKEEDTRNQSITMDIAIKDLGLPPGNYDLTIATSGGQTVLPGSVQINYKDLTDDDSILPPVAPLVLNVYPSQFRLDYAPPTIQISGDFFGSPGSQVQFAALGGVPLGNPIPNGDNHSLVFDLPIEQLTATNYNLELDNEAGRTVLTNAIQILPVPTPLITSLMPTPLKIGPFAPDNGYPLFSTGDFIDLSSFAANMKAAKDNAAISLNSLLNPTTIAELQNYSDANSGQLLTNLTANLNVLLYGPSLAGRFNEVSLRPETSILRAEEPQGMTLVYLNRLVLEDAFPTEIARNANALNTLVPSPLLTSADIANLPFLAEQLAAPSTPADPVAIYIKANLTPATTGPEDMQAFLTGLVKDLNTLIAGPSIYNAKVFAGVELRTQTQNIENEVTAGHMLSGEEVQYLNRWLLEDAWPNAISRIPQTSPPTPLKLSILGGNFQVGDGSLKIAIGGTFLTNRPAVSLGGQMISVDLYSNDLKALPAGAYELDVISTGGRGVLSNAIQIVGAVVPPVKGTPVITQIFPKHGYLFSTTEFNVSGSNFLAVAEDKTPGVVTNVTIGGRSCQFTVVSDKILQIVVPGWSKFESTNDLFMATNKLDLVVASSLGVATLTNAVTFDLVLPNDADHAVPLTPDEIKAQKMLDAVFYGERVLGTNLVLKPEIKLDSSVGAGHDYEREKHIVIPGISAGVRIGPAAASPIGVTTNSPSSP